MAGARATRYSISAFFCSLFLFNLHTSTLCLRFTPLLNMAEPGQRNLPTAFAPPPPLWKHFTPENVRKLEEIKDASRGEDGSSQRKKKWSPAELRTLDLPPELRYLVPPELPTESYSVFGELQSVCYLVKLLGASN